MRRLLPWSILGWIYMILGTAVFILAVLNVWKLLPHRASLLLVPPPSTIASTSTTETLLPRALDGVLVAAGKEYPLLAGVMLENMQEAQPISGIDGASVVYESLAEAGITRFLAVYPLEQGLTSPDTIGPVRSIRPYYLDWSEELGALLAHVGGSPDAMTVVHRDRLLTLDQWYKSQYFWRNSERDAPHNVYTSRELLAKALTDLISRSYLETRSTSLTPWIWKEETPQENRGTASRITIPYPDPYAVRWEYHPDTNLYRRIQWGGEHQTSDKQTINVKNLIVVYQTMEVLDAVGRKQFTTLGQGKTLVFHDGARITGTWKKSSRNERMKFYGTNGQELPLNAGHTWISIVPSEYKITVDETF